MICVNLGYMNVGIDVFVYEVEVFSFVVCVEIIVI